MNRSSPLWGHLRAGMIHLGISATVALAMMTLIFGIWYPGAFAAAQGVSRLVLILIAVDVVIGPLITTVIYRPGKKGLVFDLGVIAMLQTVALLYGLQSIYVGRPAYVVFNVDRFDLVSAKDVDAGSAARAAPEFRPSFWTPKTLAARRPTDPDARNALLFSAVSGGPDLPQMPQYFIPIEEAREEMLAHLRPLNELRRLNELDAAAWQKLLDDFGRTEDELGYLAMSASARDGAVILDARTSEILDIRMLLPSYAPLRPKTQPATEQLQPTPRLSVTQSEVSAP